MLGLLFLISIFMLLNFFQRNRTHDLSELGKFAFLFFQRGHLYFLVELPFYFLEKRHTFFFHKLNTLRNGFFSILIVLFQILYFLDYLLLYLLFMRFLLPLNDLNCLASHVLLLFYDLGSLLFHLLLKVLVLLT